MNIELYDETNKVAESDQELIHSILTFAAKYLELPENSETSITLVDNERIREINKEYRNKDQATDVISFANLEEEEDSLFDWSVLEDEIPHDLGDLFISIEKAAEQAVDYGHSFERELGFLALHGFLHLNGYDHIEKEDEKEMFDLQKKILKEYGLERPSEESS